MYPYSYFFGNYAITAENILLWQYAVYHKNIDLFCSNYLKGEKKKKKDWKYCGPSQDFAFNENITIYC
jgi:hypothetical protein